MTFVNQIFTGDVLDVLKSLPDNIVNLGVTSPPYNKKGSKNKGWLVKDVKYDSIDDCLPETEYQAKQIEILDEIFRITSVGGSFFYNHKIRCDFGKMIHPMEWLSKTKWNIRQEIVWDRIIASNIRGWRFWQVEERIYWLHKPDNGNLIGEEMKSRHSKLGSIWRFSPERGSSHPAPFPIELPTRCIYSILDDSKDKLILDPYMGSGTTAVAAKLLGHYYIGIDISEKYVKMAEERIKNSKQEIKSIEDELSEHVVEESFRDRKTRGVWDKIIKKKKPEMTLDTWTNDEKVNV